MRTRTRYLFQFISSLRNTQSLFEIQSAVSSRDSYQKSSLKKKLFSLFPKKSIRIGKQTENYFLFLFQGNNSLHSEDKLYDFLLLLTYIYNDVVDISGNQTSSASEKLCRWR